MQGSLRESDLALDNIFLIFPLLLSCWQIVSLETMKVSRTRKAAKGYVSRKSQRDQGSCFFSGKSADLRAEEVRGRLEGTKDHWSVLSFIMLNTWPWESWIKCIWQPFANAELLVCLWKLAISEQLGCYMNEISVQPFISSSNVSSLSVGIRREYLYILKSWFAILRAVTQNQTPL